MSARELYVLGTASQIPTRDRNHNGYFLRWDNEGILFDPGEGAQRQLTLAGLSASAITRICITHFHGDHCLGLPGIIQRFSLENVPLVKVHYPASGQEYFEHLRRASVFAGFEKLEPRPIRSGGILDEDDSFVLEAFPLEHDIECYGFRVRERERFRIRRDRLDATGLQGPIVGELLRTGSVQQGDKIVRRHEVTEVKPGQSFALIMDTRPCEGANLLALAADLLLCEATFLSSERELAWQSGHMTAEEAAILARDSGARKLVLSHFSQRYEDAEVLVAEARTIHQDVVAAEEPHPGKASTRHRISVPPRKETRFHGQFEAHITVDTDNPEYFCTTCEALGVKSILIELSEGVEPNQPMTESRHCGDLNVVRAEVDGLAQQFHEAGFAVRRRKIEAAYNAQGVPEQDEDTRGLPPSCYFEYHVSIRLANAEQLRMLQQTAAQYGAQVSRNARRKDSDDGSEVRFVTMRAYRVGRQTAEERYLSLVQALQEAACEITGERREFTVYDSNLDLDKGWLS